MKRGAASSPVALSGVEGKAGDAADGLSRPEGGGAEGRASAGVGLAARPQARLRDAPRRRRRGPARRPDDARARRHRDDGDLHARLAGADPARLRPDASPRLTAAVPL